MSHSLVPPCKQGAGGYTYIQTYMCVYMYVYIKQYIYIYLYIFIVCFFIVCVFPKFSTLEIKNKKFGPQIRTLHEMSSLEPAPKVCKPMSRSQSPSFYVVFEQYKVGFNDFWLFLRSRSCTGSSGRLVGRIFSKFGPNPRKPLPLHLVFNR